MEIKETYTREEADFMSIMSAVIGQNPHTFQGNSAYWDLVEVDFETKTKLKLSTTKNYIEI